MFVPPDFAKFWEISLSFILTVASSHLSGAGEFMLANEQFCTSREERKGA
jgi:hypothetical protein